MKTTILSLILFGLVSSCNQVAKDSKTDRHDHHELSSEAESQLELSSDEQRAEYAERGLEYALNTQAVLGKNLTQSIQDKGILGALAFCNENAYPLTDSMAVAQNARLKRVSDKPRNENNTADTQEIEHINTFKQTIANEVTPTPIVSETDTTVTVYYPILTNTMCLQCHGQPDSGIESSTLKEINRLYPNDQAIGYNINEVRGLWRVLFDK